MGLVSLIESGASKSTQYAGPKIESNGKLRGHQSNVKNMTNLIATVRIAAITSSDPPSTRLFGKEGSYSHWQIAVVVSIAAIFVMWAITATLAMLTT